MKRHAGIKLPAPLEETEQVALFTWAQMQSAAIPEIGLMHHIPNGGKRNAVEAAKFKRMGVKKGVPDIFLPVARGCFHGLYVELKRRDGSKPSREQNDMIGKLIGQGYCVCVCNGFEEARDAILAYLGGRNE